MSPKKTASKDGLSILVVDDEAVVRESLSSWFEEDGYEVGAARDAQDALRSIREHTWDMAFVDIKMPGMDGLELQRRIREVSPQTTVIIMTAFAAVDSAVQALKEGAYDYIVKPFDPDHLTHLVRKAAERDDLVRENQNLKRQLRSVSAPRPMVGTSPAIKRVSELVETVAPTDTTVLITGESGTGKELVARAVHAASPRSFMPLVVVNCGALPEGILESELFGHERGAFTGAQFRHKGKFELADGGTLFLDEIAEITPRIQVELLRVIEDKHVTRVGGQQSVRADFRLVAATNKNLQEEMREGRFREDLYYRINVFHVHLAPLRERREDIAPLTSALIERLALSMNMPIPEITDEALRLLISYHWPGNVRELQNALERALVVHRGDRGPLRPEHLPIDASAATAAGAAPDHFPSLAEIECTHVTRALEATGWNIARAATILGIDRSTVYNKIKQHSLRRPVGAPTGGEEQTGPQVART